jgi:hypothetical protein
VARDGSTVKLNGAQAVPAQEARSIEKGYRVILVLKPNVALLRVYGGLVKAVDDFGLRITLGDWLIGRFCGNDFWAAWGNVDSMLVYTPDDDMEDFVEKLACWQHHFTDFATVEEKQAGEEKFSDFLEHLAERRRDRGGDYEFERPGRRRSADPRPAVPTFVYFLQRESGGAIKIGVAGDIKKRMSALQTAFPDRLRVLGTQSGGRDEETALHRRFAAHRLHGEWFAPAPELLAYIEGLG